MDDRTEAVGVEHLLKSAEKKTTTSARSCEEVQLSTWEGPANTGSLPNESLFYRQCGYIIRTLMKMLLCETCLSALKHHGPVMFTAQ